mmetsp:Transcript_25631/g.29453  ORF Transcript_25631/g.29453 Transcript_25631/m.29453 type:complete len:203 (-) Transcript_25631:94-702(-)
MRCLVWTPTLPSNLRKSRAKTPSSFKAQEQNFSEFVSEADSENDVETMGNTSDQESSSSDDDLTRAPRLRAISLEHLSDTDHFELPIAAVDAVSKFGQVCQLESISKRTKKSYSISESQSGEKSRLEKFEEQLQASFDQFKAIKLPKSDVSSSEINSVFSFLQGGKSAFPGSSSATMMATQKISKNSILGFLASKSIVQDGV